MPYHDNKAVKKHRQQRNVGYKKNASKISKSTLIYKWPLLDVPRGNPSPKSMEIYGVCARANNAEVCVYEEPLAGTKEDSH